MTSATLRAYIYKVSTQPDGGYRIIIDVPGSEHLQVCDIMKMSQRPDATFQMALVLAENIPAYLVEDDN